MAQDKSRPEFANESYPDEIDLVDVFRFFYKEKWLLLGGALLGGLIGFIIVKAKPGQYETKFTVKQEYTASSVAIPLERLNATLQVVTGSPDMIAEALQKVAQEFPEFEKALSEKNMKISEFAQTLAAAKPQDRIVKLEAGASPKYSVLSLSLPFKVLGEQAPAMGVSILNHLAMVSNQEKLEEQNLESPKSPGDSPSEHSLAMVRFTEASGKLGALEAKLLSEVSPLLQNYVSSAGFAGSTSPLEAQFARIRFLLGIKADKNKGDANAITAIQNEFLELREKVSSAQVTLDLANEAERELIKKNLQVTPNDTLPQFVSTAKSPSDLIQLEKQSKKVNLGLLAGIFLGGMLSFMGILTKRFLGDNWQRIIAADPK